MGRTTTGGNLEGSGSVESLVGTVDGVVDQAVVEGLVQVLPEQGVHEGDPTQGHLQGEPEPLDECDAAVLPDGTEAMQDPQSGQRGLEDLGCELASPRKDSIAWRGERPTWSSTSEAWNSLNLDRLPLW
jgi:hypothetical protein